MTADNDDPADGGTAAPLEEAGPVAVGAVAAEGGGGSPPCRRVSMGTGTGTEGEEGRTGPDARVGRRRAAEGDGAAADKEKK